MSSQCPACVDGTNGSHVKNGRNQESYKSLLPISPINASQRPGTYCEPFPNGESIAPGDFPVPQLRLSLTAVSSAENSVRTRIAAVERAGVGNSLSSPQPHIDGGSVRNPDV